MKSQIIIFVLPLSSLSKIKWLVHGNTVCFKESRRLEMGVLNLDLDWFCLVEIPVLEEG